MITRNPDIVVLAAIVARLGESSQHKWWQSGFTGSSGVKILQQAFPRTFRSAGLNSAYRAARRMHDAKVGKLGTYHLFRLPQMEGGTTSSHSVFTDMEWSDTVGAELLSFSDEQLMDALKNLAGEPVDDRKPEGPMMLDVSAKGDVAKAVTEMASLYYYGFLNNKQVFPYFRFEEDRR